MKTSIHATLVKIIKDVKANINLQTIIMVDSKDNHERLEKMLEELRKESFLLEVLDTQKLEVLLVPVNLRPSNWYREYTEHEKFFVLPKDRNNDQIEVRTPFEMFNLNTSSYQYNASEIKFLIKKSSDPMKLNLIGMTSESESFEDFEVVWMPITKLETIDNQVSLDNKGTEYTQRMLRKFNHEASSLSVLASPENTLWKELNFKLDETFIPVPLLSAMKVGNYERRWRVGNLSSIFGDGVFVESQKREDEYKYILKQLIRNVSKHIQYPHIKYLFNSTQIIVSLIADAPREKKEAMCDILLNGFKSETLRINVPDFPDLCFVKETLPVPKNGEKFCGNRNMIFRRTLENCFMAIGVSTLYSLINVPKENLGSRIVNNKLIPYIHTYNLFQDECMELAKEYKYCRYLDLSKFFESVTFELINDAVLYFADELREESIRKSLYFIEMAMKGNKYCHNHLTIDSNYEHALSTIVIAYILDKTRKYYDNVEFRTFVDDIVLFSDSEVALELFNTELSAILLNANLKLNHEKTKHFEGENYDLELKQLVFLPTGLRYRVDDSFKESDILVIQGIKKQAYIEFIGNNVKPKINAFSDIESFTKNFKYEEACWVKDNYDNLCKRELSSYFPLTEENILEFLQNATLRSSALSKDELDMLQITMELYPSKQKWIMSLLKSIDKELVCIYRKHYSPYMRFLVDGEMEAAYKKPLLGNTVIQINDDLELKSVRSTLTEKGMKCVDIQSDIESISDIKLILRKGGEAHLDKPLYITYSPNSLLYFFKLEELDSEPLSAKLWSFYEENRINFNSGRLVNV